MSAPLSRDARAVAARALLIAGSALVISAVTLALLRGPSTNKAIMFAAGLVILAAGRWPNRATAAHRTGALVVMNTIVAILLLELGAIAAYWLVIDVPKPDPAYTEQEWGGEYVRDENASPGMGYVPYVIWKMKPYRSSSFNVRTDGSRVTPGANCGLSAFTVFMFGGSTMWGTGVPDWATIPAYVQQGLAASQSRPVCVENLSQSGWVSTQGVIELLRRLQAGERPDLVVFYDGINDVEMSFGEGIAGAHHQTGTIAERLERADQAGSILPLLRFSRTYRFIEALRSESARPPAKDPDRTGLATATANAYVANYRAVNALSNEFGFSYAFFWQPRLFYGSKPFSREESELSLGRAGRMLAFAQATTGVVLDSLSTADRFFDIRDIFDRDTARVYLDEQHLLPRGNEQVAKRMLDLLGR